MIAENAEEYYKIIVESSFNGIAVTDEQGNFEYVNESFLKMIGWPKEELIGQNFIKIIPEDLHESAIKICSEVQEEANNSQEIKIKTRNGELKYLKSLHKLTKINGKLKTISITEDVTENIMLKQKLNNSNKQRKLLCYLIKGTRGGKTRTLILKYLNDTSYNAHQLAKVLNMDYKTIRHHLGILVKNEIITKDNNGGSAVYFISKNIQSDLNEFNSELPYNKG